MSDYHQFFQDPIDPRNIGFCDYTYFDGDYCGIAKEDHDMMMAELEYNDYHEQE